MAIRTITWTVDEDMRVSPTRVQDAGVQGDDNATRVVFSLPAFLQEGYTLYLEYIDGAGGYDKTEPLTVGDGAVSVTLPLAWTQHGGKSTVRLVAEQDGVVAYTAEGHVRYAGRTTAFAKIKSLINGSIQMMLDKVTALICEGERTISAAVGAADSANAAANNANSAADSANAAAERSEKATDTVIRAEEAAQEALETADEAVERAESVMGVYIGSGDMPDGYTVQVDPEGEALLLDNEMSDTSENVPKTKVVKAYVDNARSSIVNERVDVSAFPWQHPIEACTSYLLVIGSLTPGGTSDVTVYIIAGAPWSDMFPTVLPVKDDYGLFNVSVTITEGWGIEIENASDNPAVISLTKL